MSAEAVAPTPFTLFRDVPLVEQQLAQTKASIQDSVDERLRILLVNVNQWEQAQRGLQVKTDRGETVEWGKPEGTYYRVQDPEGKNLFLSLSRFIIINSQLTLHLDRLVEKTAPDCLSGCCDPSSGVSEGHLTFACFTDLPDLKQLRKGPNWVRYTEKSDTSHKENLYGYQEGGKLSLSIGIDKPEADPLTNAEANANLLFQASLVGVGFRNSPLIVRASMAS